MPSFIHKKEWFDENNVEKFTILVPQPYNKIGDGPEGPEVYVMTKKMRDRFPNGFKLVSLTSLSDRYDPQGPDEIPDNFTTALPLTIDNIFSKGKKTVVLFNNDWSLLISYGMSGGWRTRCEKQSQIEFDFNDFAGRSRKYYWGTSRSLPTAKVEFLSHNELYKKLDKLGHDICIDNPGEKEILAVWPKTAKNICSFIMDQSSFCGIGNYIKAVTLYRCKISPHRKVNSLSEQEKIAIWQTAKKVAEEAIASKATASKATFDITPYNKKTDSEGYKVKCEKTSDGRMTWWVPEVQK